MKAILFTICSLLTALTAGAQDLDRPVVAPADRPAEWEITAVHGEKDNYTIQFHVRLGSGWHVWSLHPGADSSLVPPSISIDLATATPVGVPMEQGITTDMQLPGVEGFARFYNNEALFTQAIQAAKGRTVKGSYTYQLCNDKLCLPPKTVPFAVKLP